MGSNYLEEQNTSMGGGFGFGGGGLWLIFILIIAWILFERRDGKDGREGYGGYSHGGCGCLPPMGRPHFPDESNFEEERNINSKLCCLDKDIWENGWKDREAIHGEGEKTRALIEANYIQDLRDKLSDKNTEIVALKSQIYSDAKFGDVFAAIGKTNAEIAHLTCETPKRPPVWADCYSPTANRVERGCDDFPRRGHCGFAESVA